MSDSPQSSRRTSAIVVSLFPSPTEAGAAISDLVEAGFRQEDIGVAIQDEHEPGKDHPAPGEGAARGALSGGIVGGALGLLGSLLLPGIGPIVAGGVLATTLAGAGIGAATGGLIGALIGMGLSEEDAEHFDRGFREGGVLLTVTANERAMEARAILRDRQGDLGPSFEGSDLRRSETAGTVPAGPPWDTDDPLDEEGEVDPEAALDTVEEMTDTWSGRERRSGADPAYAGPERRVAAGR